MDRTQSNPQDLAIRIARLETEGRRWKLATAVLSLFTILFVAIAAKPAQRMEPTVIRTRAVEAEQFVLKGEDGRTYARLSLNPDLQRANDHPPSPAALEFFDVNGHVAVVVPATPKVIPAR